jgi:hypothetical protein
MIILTGRGFSAQPGQLGMVTGVGPVFVTVCWDRLSGTLQNNGGYSRDNLRPATGADAQAYLNGIRAWRG